MHVLVTGANGFIGKNLQVWLGNRADTTVTTIGRDSSAADLSRGLADAEVVIHLAGINRPETDEEFRTGNVDFTATICAQLAAAGKATPILFASSTQAALDNPYGRSKRAAEEVLAGYAANTGARVVVFRLTNVYGKWCRPHYNSVVATFCHQIARDQSITISDPTRVVSLVHVDDVAQALLAHMAQRAPGGLSFADVGPVQEISLGDLAALLRDFRAMRQSLVVPDLSVPFTHRLYSTYLSYLDEDQFAYNLEKRCDPRGCLAEFVKSPPFGQIFVSRTKPGITRGNHYHHVKTEKFLVMEGQAIVRFRHVLTGDVLAYPVQGDEFRVIDIPPGYTHSIENVGSGELITLFWASEIFDQTRPDTVYLDVLTAPTEETATEETVVKGEVQA